MSALEGEILAPQRAPAAAGRGATFVYSPSPFQRGATRAIVLPEGGTIADAVTMAGIGPRLRRHVAVYLAEHRIDPKHWKRIRPKPGALLYMRVELHGKDGKDILRTVLMIAVVVVATMIAGPIGAAFGLGSIGTTLLTVGLVTVGQMLVNALIPPPQPKMDPYRFDQQPGNPYGSLTGIRNQYAPYAPIPRVMGERRMFPMLAARPYTEVQGKTQWLRLLLLVGYGPIHVSDIRIGQTPITAFAGAEYEILEGWPDDAAPRLYSRQIREMGMSVYIEPAVGVTPGPWLERDTETSTQEVSIDIGFPNGLVGIDPDDGDQSARTVVIDVQWSANGGSSWNNADWIDGRSDYGTGTDGQLICTATSTSAEVRSGRFNVTGNASGQYKVRIRRRTDDGPSYIIDDSYWTVLRSVRQDNPVAMSGLCLIGLRLQATKQLNGIPDVINCLASAYHQVYDSNAGTWSYQLTRNPAWQSADLLKRRGETTMLADSRIDLDAIAAWAAANDVGAPNAQEKRWTSDIVLEGGSVLSALQLIMASGRAALSVIDGKYSVVRDVEQATPVAHITPRNSWGYRGSKSFADIPHALRVSFINPDKNDAPDEVIVFRDDYNEDGSGGKTAATKYDTLDLPACRSAAMAWREGRYHLAVLELRPEEHTVNQDIESLSCTNGALVRLSHDAVSIGLASGRVVAVNAVAGFVTAITIDAEVEMDPLLSYAVRVRHADLSSSVHTLVNSGDTSNVLTFSTPVAEASAPDVGDLAMFGQATIETAPMIVKRIERADNLTARVIMVDAQSGVYTADTGTIPAFQSYINRSTRVDPSERPARPILHVRSDEASLLRLSDGTLIERVELWIETDAASTVPAVSWEAQWKPAGTNGDDWESIARSGLDAHIYLTGRAAGQVIHLRARTITAHEIPSEWEYVWDHAVVGKTTPPDAPTGFAVAATLDGGKGSWTPSSAVDVVGYEMRYGGANWDAATVLGFIFGRGTKQIFHTIAIAGGETFRLKAVDAAGLYSTEVTATATGRTNASGGVIIDWRGLPTNTPGGTAIVRSVNAPLSSSSSTSISVAAHTVYLPGQSISLPSDTITGLSSDTVYYVFWDVQSSDYIAVTNYTAYYTDTTGRYIACGYQQTQNGSGSWNPLPPPPGGGGGGAYGGGGCVVLEAHVFGAGVRAGALEAGDKIFLTAEDMGADAHGTIVSAQHKLQRCVRLVCENGVTLTCSTSAPIPTRDCGLVLAPGMLDLDAATMLHGERAWSRVVHVEQVGERWVNHIDAGDRCFWAGDCAGSYILHHNKVTDPS